MRKPKRRYTVEGVRVVYSIHDTYDVRFPYFRFEVLSVLWAGCVGDESEK